MSQERPTLSDQPRLPNGFALTETEQLYDRVGYQRLLGWLEDEHTTIHRVGIDSNSYGEFLFVTLSRATASHQETLTFYGLGYHAYRDRWFTDEWAYYRSQRPGDDEPSLDREETLQQLSERAEQVAGYSARTAQSMRGALFEFIADLTDDDGAMGELDDLTGWLTGWDEDEG